MNTSDGARPHRTAPVATDPHTSMEDLRMLIDASLAHGLAQRSHRELRRNDARVAQQMTREHRARSTMPDTWKGARRYLRDVLRPIKPRAIYLLETETRREGPACRYLDFRACDEDQQLVLVRGCCAPLSPVSKGGEAALALFSRHALARGHQRCNEMLWEQLKPHVAEAAEPLWLMNAVATALGLKQGFLATSDGLFVGDYLTGGLLHLKTFIRLDQSYGRWPQVHALMQALRHRFALTKDQLLAALASNEGAALAAARDWLADKLALPRYHWLHEAHEERPDPVSERWQQAREAVAAELACSEEPRAQLTARAA